MSTPPPGNPLWQDHIERLRRLYEAPPAASSQTAARGASLSDHAAANARRGEMTASPVGRLGRRLLADIEPYLAFFAIARADRGEPDGTHP